MNLRHLCTRMVVVAALYVGTALLTACGPDAAATPEPVTITIAGATALHPALAELATAFQENHPHVHVVLRGGGSRLGESQVSAGEIDLAASTLTPLPATPAITATVVVTDILQTEPLVHIPIALDGLAIITNARNELANLTLLQLRDLYSGRTTEWAEGNRAGEEVLLITRERDSGAWQLFTARVMGQERVSLTAIVMPTNADVVEYVARHPFAIGYASRAYVAHLLADTADSSTQDNGNIAVASDGAAASVSIVRLEGEHPLATNLQSQNYHLAYPLYLAHRGDPIGWPREFIDFALSDVGQQIVGRYHARVR